MKTFKTALVVFIAALLPLALFAAPSAAVLGDPDQGDVAGANLHQEKSASDHTKLSPPFTAGQQISLAANFTDGVRTVTIYRNTGSGWTSIASKQSASNGNAYFPYTVIEGNQKLFAEATGDLETEVDEIDVPVTPPPTPQTGVLNAPSTDGKNWTADFTTGVAGTVTKLQIQRIYTVETNEVNEDPSTPKKGPWVTIATANQDAAGHVVFPALSSPYPYRVQHNYRATSGNGTSNNSNTVKFGLDQVTPESTGLAAVYFNTNEGHAVDTRTRYFEGEFAITDGALGCTKIGYTDGKSATDKPIKESVMKGRGNYSWSFKRKSYTLKIGKKNDVCGMGISKKYALVSQDYDKSFLRNALAQYIGSKLDGMAWTPKSRPVDFYLNGKYMGNYLLVERIAIQGSVTE